MDTNKYMKLVLLVIAIFLLFKVPIMANPVPQFVDYQQARANMTWAITSNDQEETLFGDFHIVFPDKYLFIYDTESNQAGKQIASHQGVTAFFYQGNVEYQYYTSSLFTPLDDLFLPLTFILDVSGEWLGVNKVAGREAYQYRTSTEPVIDYFLDSETGLPLRVVIDNEYYLNTLRYKETSSGDLRHLSVDLNSEQWNGSLSFSFVNGHWFPQEIQIEDEHVELVVQFENWQVNEESLDLFDLEELVNAKQQGQKAYEQGDWAQVISNYQKVLRLDPFYEFGYFYLAYGYGVQGNYLGAIENYQQWLMLEPDNSFALNNLAYTYMLEEINLHRALEYAKKAVSQDPRPAYLDTLGYGYYLLGDYDLALEYFLQALEGIGEELKEEVYEHIIAVYHALNDEENEQKYQNKLAIFIEGQAENE